MPARHRLGSLHLNILSDGLYYQDAGAVFGIVPRCSGSGSASRSTTATRCRSASTRCSSRRRARRCSSRRASARRSARCGQTERPGGGTLLDDLRAAGVAPDDVDIVINTHLHADHCGWNTRKDADGAYVPTFPRARYLIQRGEWDAATHPNERTRATYLPENMLPLEASGQLELIDGETRVTDEITIIPTHGHTADHASVVLASGGEKAIYIGDMIQHPVQLERAAWVSSFDVYPLEAMETKKAHRADARSTRNSS